MRTLSQPIKFIIPLKLSWILHAIDGNKAVVLLMFDLSAAFDSLILCLMKYYWIGCLNVMILQGLYKNGWYPTCHFVHNLFNMNVQDLLYRKGLSLGLSYMFCTLHR